MQEWHHHSALIPPRRSVIKIILSINQWFDQHLQAIFAESQRTVDLELWATLPRCRNFWVSPPVLGRNKKRSFL